MKMHHSHRLKCELKATRSELTALRCGLKILRGYLSLPKFQEDTTVQVQDVFLRLHEAEYAAVEAHWDTKQKWFAHFRDVARLRRAQSKATRYLSTFERTLVDSELDMVFWDAILAEKA